MGLFGSLFDKKTCDICGGEIGLLGNRKLENGNMCKNCAALISPFMTDRRQTTVDEMQQHLLYRAKNQEDLKRFNPTRIMGNRTKIYLDEAQRLFAVSYQNNWRNFNPDLISLDQVSDCKVRISESRREIKHPDREGKMVPYNPPRFEFSYTFNVDILINSQWFDEIHFELSEQRPDSVRSPLYREYEAQAAEIEQVMMSAHYVQPVQAVPVMGTPVAAKPVTAAASGSWVCGCGQTNTGKFCTACGQKKPASYRCDKCGWVPDDPANPPKFCPMCGDPMNESDLG